MIAKAIAHPNIAFIKYWGNRDARLRLPLTGSFSMALDGLGTRTRVEFDADFPADSFALNGEEQQDETLARVSGFLDRVRELSSIKLFARVESENNFPTGAGIASSASAFAALALAVSTAAGLDLNAQELSALARRGSGSACRSVPGGFAEWLPGSSDADSYAVQVAPPDYWDLVDAIAILHPGQKEIGSTEGHALAGTSPLNALRVAGNPERLVECRLALLGRDFERLARVVEADSHWMHAVMRTSSPPLFYWTANTETILWHVLTWRKQGHAVCATVDAGPNVHIITTQDEKPWVEASLRELPGVQEVLCAGPGAGVRLIADC